MFKKLRVAVLLYILVVVAAGAWLTGERTTDWNDALWVVVYPIAGDGAASTVEFVDSLEPGDFRDIEAFISREAQRYGVPIERPVAMKLAGRVHELPPPPPAERSVVRVMMWSLHMRYWAWKVEGQFPDIPADIRIFAVFHDPEKHSDGHDSLALREGLIGVVNGFAHRRYKRRNNIIITHEMLHTVGATDKYDLGTNLPIHPYGYAEPDRNPLYPQKKTEIMGGRRAISSTQAEIPNSLKSVVIGPLTAREIRWTQNP